MAVSLTYTANLGYFQEIERSGTGDCYINGQTGNIEIDRPIRSNMFSVAFKVSRKLYCFTSSPKLSMRWGQTTLSTNIIKQYYKDSLEGAWILYKNYGGNVANGTSTVWDNYNPNKDLYIKIELTVGNNAYASKFSILNLLYSDVQNYGNNQHLFNMADESTLNSQIEQNYILRSNVEQNYTLNSLIEQNYYLKSYVEANYTLTTNLQNDYILRTIVESDYTLKSDLQVNYVERTSPLVLTEVEQQFFLGETGERILEVRKV